MKPLVQRIVSCHHLSYEASLEDEAFLKVSQSCALVLMIQHMLILKSQSVAMKNLKDDQIRQMRWDYINVNNIDLFQS